MAKGRKKKAKASGEAQSQGALIADGPSPARTDGADFARRYLLRSLEVFLYWMPVWVPLILLAQLGTRGLKPALHERERLLNHEQRLLDRLETDEAEAERLSDTLEALDDPIFIERLRRQRVEEQRLEVERRGLTPEPPGDADDSQGSASQDTP